MFRKMIASTPLITLGILAERLIHASHYNCHPKTYTLIVANYANITLFLSFIVLQLSIRPYAPSRAMVGTFAILCVVFFFLFNFIGFGWFLDELFAPRSCIKKSDFLFLGTIFVFLILLIIFAFVFMILAIVHRRNQRIRQQFYQFQRDPEAVKSELIRRNLGIIYTNPGVLGRPNIEKFFENAETATLMIKLPLVSNEKKLIKEHFCSTLSEERLAELHGNENGSCPVCLVEFGPSEPCYGFDCGHVFHQGCIELWMNTKVSCPSCRANLRHRLAMRLLKAYEMQKG